MLTMALDKRGTKLRTAEVEQPLLGADEILRRVRACVALIRT